MQPMSVWKAAKLVPRGRNKLSELTLITTTACNFRCRHCFMIAELNKRAPELTADEMLKMGAHMPKMRRVHLGGGEPFARRDIGDKALIASNEWRSEVVCIPTNGWYGKQVLRTIESFGKDGKGQLRIHFSINTMPSDMDAFTGVKGSFTRWRESIRDALELARQFKNVTVLCLATYNEDSKLVFDQLKDFVVTDVKPDDFSMQLARAHENYATNYDTTGFNEVVRDYFRNDSIQPWYLTAYRELIREHTVLCKGDPTQIPKCRSGTSRLVIAPNGDVYPCESKGYPNGEDYSQWLMGNVRDFGFDIEELLRSEAARRVQQRVASEPCTCQHGIDIALNLLSSRTFQLRVVMRGLAHALHRTFTRASTC
jgi:radical SAM protein with 4Fe4S-binding SPASM domain